MADGYLPTTYFVSNGHELCPVDGAVIDETSIALRVNGRTLATFMCSPVDVEELALGFLRNEMLIAGPEDIKSLAHSPASAGVDVRLHHEIPETGDAIRTSGCCGGVTYDDLSQVRRPLPNGLCLSSQAVIDRYFDMRAAERLYPIARGVHTSGLSTAEKLLLISEDIGRHNTIDKLWGHAMRRDINPAGSLILTTGRISSEMVGKAAKMGAQIVASRTSPTSRALILARAWNVTIIGYVRRKSLRVYTVPERIETVKE
jgi:FdhD protein